MPSFYKKSANTSEDCFDVITLDQKTLFITSCFVNSKHNPHQKTISVSGHLEKTLLGVLIKLNKTIGLIEKSFSLDRLAHMINSRNTWQIRQDIYLK